MAVERYQYDDFAKDMVEHPSGDYIHIDTYKTFHKHYQELKDEVEKLRGVIDAVQALKTAIVEWENDTNHG